MRRRTIFSPLRCSACRRGRRRGGLQVHNLASWRCVSWCVSAWAKARQVHVNDTEPAQRGEVHLQRGDTVHSPASWRCLPRRVSAWAKAWWHVALGLYRLRAAWGATGQLSGIWLGLWASAPGGAAQSASMFMGHAKPRCSLSRRRWLPSMYLILLARARHPLLHGG